MSGQDAVLAACPLCGGSVHWCGTKDADDLHDCHQITCPTCGQFDLKDEANCESMDDVRANVVAAWNRRATPASDEAVGELPPLPISDKSACFPGDENWTICYTSAHMHAYARAALSARTAAPAEQGVTDAMVERACVLRFGEREWAALSISRRHGESIIMRSILADAFGETK